MRIDAKGGCEVCAIPAGPKLKVVTKAMKGEVHSTLAESLSQSDAWKGCDVAVAVCISNIHE